MTVLVLKTAEEMTKEDIRIVLNTVWLVAGHLDKREHHEAYANLQRAIEAVEQAYLGQKITDYALNGGCPVCHNYSCTCPDDGDAVGQMMGTNV